MKYIVTNEMNGIMEILDSKGVIAHANSIGGYDIDNLNSAIILLKREGYRVFESQDENRTLSGMDIDDFYEWMNSDNVIKNRDGSYSTQDSNFRNRISSIDELKRYYKREFGGSYAKGGKVDSNFEMVKSQAKELMHHSKELMQVLKKHPHIEAWVVAKIERATTDLSDVTHYLDGTFAKGGSVGNVNKWEKGDITIVNGEYLKRAEVVPSYKDDTMRSNYFVVFRDENKKIIDSKDNFESYKDALKYAKENVNTYAKGGMTHQFTFKRGGHIEIVNADEVYDKKKYDAIFGDYDNDGIMNVDDEEPLNASKKSNVEALKFADSFDYLLNVKSQLDDIMEDSIEILKNNSPETADIYARTKTPYSILKKLIFKRMLDPKKGLTDMVGTTIAVDNYKQLQSVKNEIQSGILGEVMDFDDFYANPNAGYMAYHFIVRVKGIPVEVQLKTKRMKKLNMISHEFYKDGTLNAEGLEKLTNLTLNADKGDKEAIKEYNELMKNKAKIQSLVSTK